MFVHQNTWVMVLELALKNFVKGLSVNLVNTWELVLELALKTLVKGLSVSLGNT